MVNSIWNNLRMFLWMTFITGLIYPLLITLIAQLTMNSNANGSFISKNNKLIGSSLIAQKFEKDKYFWPRPSAVDYNPLPSGGSNLGPTSKALQKLVEDRKITLTKIQNSNKAIPSEMLFASGSGLDPHITPETAYYQIDRILKARNLNERSHRDSISSLIAKTTTSRSLHFLGEPYVNVLELNLALDELNPVNK